MDPICLEFVTTVQVLQAASTCYFFVTFLFMKLRVLDTITSSVMSRPRAPNIFENPIGSLLEKMSANIGTSRSARIPWYGTNENRTIWHSSTVDVDLRWKKNSSKVFKFIYPKIEKQKCTIVPQH